MKRFGQILLIGLLVVGISGVAFGQGSPTLDKIKNSGVFTLGVRNGSPPFSFINKQNERAGFSNDLAELVHKAIEKKLGKSIKLEMKETSPSTRIPLLTSQAVDLITETMTDTRARRESNRARPMSECCAKNIQKPNWSPSRIRRRPLWRCSREK
jgi:glutamate/aspartate transport system substrate-binding protein